MQQPSLPPSAVEKKDGLTVFKEKYLLSVIGLVLSSLSILLSPVPMLAALVCAFGVAFTCAGKKRDSGSLGTIAKVLSILSFIYVSVFTVSCVCGSMLIRRAARDTAATVYEDYGQQIKEFFTELFS